MGYFFIDNRQDKQDMCDALDRFNASKRVEGDLSNLMSDLDLALKNVPVDRAMFKSQVTKLALVGSGGSAKKLVAVLGDFSIRAWWGIPLRIALWPVRVVYQIIKTIAP